VGRQTNWEESREKNRHPQDRIASLERVQSRIANPVIRGTLVRRVRRAANDIASGKVRSRDKRARVGSCRSDLFYTILNTATDGTVSPRAHDIEKDGRSLYTAREMKHMSARQRRYLQRTDRPKSTVAQGSRYVGSSSRGRTRILSTRSARSRTGGERGYGSRFNVWVCPNCRNSDLRIRSFNWVNCKAPWMRLLAMRFYGEIQQGGLELETGIRKLSCIRKPIIRYAIRTNARNFLQIHRSRG